MLWLGILGGDEGNCEWDSVGVRMGRTVEFGCAGCYCESSWSVTIRIDVRGVCGGPIAAELSRRLGSLAVTNDGIATGRCGGCHQLRDIYYTTNLLTPDPTLHAGYYALSDQPQGQRHQTPPLPRPRDRHTILNTMADASAQPKPSSSVKLVLLGEAAVGKVRSSHAPARTCAVLTSGSRRWSCVSSTTTSKRTRSRR